MSEQAQRIIERFQLLPHPEGGWYRETWRGPDGAEGRSVGTAILFLLESDQKSHWHRVDAAELWLWHAGGPLELRVLAEGEDTPAAFRLGPELLDGDLPHALVPANAWQAARPLGGWVLVSCTVSPGFDFSGFELAEPGWEPVA
ncbi:cupin domain-containing protein [Notoacmeibacter sp. MSK16QG-6]|uniref:cupin domain-containing protein n=1 Tax=Notoacmeibacter sp. MSK16QG-6 TaxID=2957982 RepID=UPI00209F5F48|nr:cupin domain-containing protein [Notoacmeibacter sp. MSK16QG-6]MCP1200139.1 cupin domain-containing protein [Notoacmeibacter sp. MSK16QG-6]